MNDERDKDAKMGAAHKNPREDRLKQALRENLKRRKSQTRSRRELTVAASDDGTSKEDDQA